MSLKLSCLCENGFLSTLQSVAGLTRHFDDLLPEQRGLLEQDCRTQNAFWHSGVV